jgi:peptidoglycan L-alanyl-D-glutamate endopeptidase CwlK
MGDLKYSRRSLDILETCDRRIQQVFHAVLKTGLIDLAIIEGRRARDRQDKLFAEGKSRVQWPNSKHNVITPGKLSMAVDAAPFVDGDVSWRAEHCIFAAGVVLATAHRLMVPLRWGGNWDMDREPVTDQDFQDLVHYELIERER